MILVTGAGGFIGHQVCQLLASRGQDVLAVDWNFPSPLTCHIMQGDLCDREFVTSLFQLHTFDAIVHLAAVLNTASRMHPEKAMHVNIGSSLNLLELAKQFNVARFIFGSSISAYGFKSYADFGPVSEVEPAAPENVYGVSKRYVEIVGEQYHKQTNLQFIALRIAMVVGAGAVNTASPWRSEIFEGIRTVQPTVIRLPFERHEVLPLIHVIDVAASIQHLLAAKQPAHVIYNTPVDNCQCGELADSIQALNQHICIAHGPSQARGDPEAIDGSRFSEEFGFYPVPIKERLRLAFTRLPSA